MAHFHLLVSLYEVRKQVNINSREMIKNITESSETRANIDWLVKVDYYDHTRKILILNVTFIANSETLLESYEISIGLDSDVVHNRHRSANTI